MAALTEAEIIIATYGQHDRGGVVFVDGLKAVAALATKRALENASAAVLTLHDDVDAPCCRATRGEILQLLEMARDGVGS